MRKTIPKNPKSLKRWQKTLRYDRLVSRLIAEERYEEAEKWIWAGIPKTEKKLPGIAGNLRNRFLEIRVRQENWPVVAAIWAEKFVKHPALQTFTECKKACDKINSWPGVRQHLISYLENGQPPWRHEEWPLPESGLGQPEPPPKSHFPKAANLIEIAIFEKNPDQVLY